MTWQPIETAPYETQVLVMRRDGVMHVAKVAGYSGRRWGVLSADFGDASCTFFFPVGGDDKSDDAPLYWQLLPDAPFISKEGE